MNENERKELARLERREAAKLLRRAERSISTTVRERLAHAAQVAQGRAIQWTR